MSWREGARWEGGGILGDTQARGSAGGQLRGAGGSLLQGICGVEGMRGGGLLKYFYFFPC